MALGKSLKYFITHMREKHRLAFRNQHTDTEVWYMHISPLNLLAGFFALVLILFIIVMSIVAFTPILDLLPGYPGSKSREMLINNIMRLDSLQQEVRNMQIYSENVALIMEGKNPVTRNDVQRMDSLNNVKSKVEVVAEDFILRSQMEATSGPYSLNDPTTGRRNLRNTMEMYAPVQGVVAQQFSPRDGQYGISLVTPVNQPVMAVADGTVIFSGWVPDHGYVIYIQHGNNLISVYRSNVNVLKKDGERVRSGEIIGYTGTPEAESSGNFEFELWHNGNAVDPMGYIVFK